MKGKISHLQSTIGEKEEEMNRLRSYFTAVIEKLDEENKNKQKQRETNEKLQTEQNANNIEY